MFQRRHYERLADWLASIPDLDRRAKTAASLADMLDRDNPRFKRDRFLRRAKAGEPVRLDIADSRAA